MRCTRCDGLTIPQATGRTPDGKLVFGWCLTCLTDTGCVDIHTADPARKHRPPSRRISMGTTLHAGHGEPPPDRRRLLSIWALLLAFWGFIMLFGGVLMRPRTANAPGSPLGNGSPPLLVVGGGATAAIGLAPLARRDRRRRVGNPLRFEDSPASRVPDRDGDPRDRSRDSYAETRPVGARTRFRRGGDLAGRALVRGEEIPSGSSLQK